MNTLRVLLIFVFIRLHHSGGEKQHYCTEQRDSIMVERGGSVTIPCHFSYPMSKEAREVKVYWRHAKDGRCESNDFIYNHTEQYTHKAYAGRITMVGNTKDRTASIRITSLRDTDGPIFCCRISLHNIRKEIKAWQNQHGTYIKFKDEFFVEQPDVVLAVIGEGISIPCAIHNTSPDDITEIIWRRGKSDFCYENAEFFRWNIQNITQKVGRWRLQKSEKSFLLNIENVRDPYSEQYCCEVTGRRRSSKRSSTHGTQVVVADPTQNNPNFTITQSGIILANEGDNATINCSYTVPPDQNLLWTGVFWRVGGQKGSYAYHPSDLMVHPNYYGRTELSGLADLQIKGVKVSDRTTYYCFVMLKFCTGNNQTYSLVKYGNGTLLNINGENKNLTETPVSNNLTEGTGQQLLGILVGVGFLIFLIILLVLLIFLKRKVQMSKVQSSDTATNQEDFGSPLYADLNMEALRAGKHNKENPPSIDNQVLYAAVKPLTNDQVIYAAVR